MRTAILHVDDLGSTHGANQAFLDLARHGRVTCGSVMAPCPWFREIAELAAADPSLDLGEHLTLTSEWRHYRCSPLSTTSSTSGLIDGDGYLWRDVASLRRHLVPEAAEAELRAQIERCLAAGMTPTHLDAHMGAAMLAELLPAHVALAREYGLFPVLPRSIKRIVVIGDTGCRLKGDNVQDCNDPAQWPFAAIARLAAARHPDLVIHVGDYHYRESPCRQSVRRQLGSLAEGLLRSCGAVARGGAVGTGARQSRAVQPRWPWLVPVARSAPGYG